VNAISHSSGLAQRIVASRSRLTAGLALQPRAPVQEGGCGVVGFAASVPVRGRHIFAPSIQMHNRGNGKGGGIAAACFTPGQLGVDAATLRDDYLLQVALLDPQAESEVEEAFVSPNLRIDHKTRPEPVADYRRIGLEIRPPDVVRYFVRVKDDSLARFAEENHLTDAAPRQLEDEFVYQNSFRLNRAFYASLGEKRAFVLSHARNLLVFKIVGYAEHVVQYYGLEDLQAQVWIAHQRYPTKGRVWHPAGSHPFVGMNEALVHNGDFANYFSISEYLRQHHIVPQFLTDTEASVQLFDLWRRTYGYPTEYVIEALAPTTELDFARLPDEKKKAYKAIQALHMHGSPDGPWFFIIARSEPDADRFQLLGITDTSMLRPQVFALEEGEATIGLVASEKQAIDATLHSLAKEDSRFRPIADLYWNARGGSHTDGGTFVFTVQRNNGQSTVSCADKFGKPITCPAGEWAVRLDAPPRVPDQAPELAQEIQRAAAGESHEEFFGRISGRIASWDFDRLVSFTGEIEQAARVPRGGRVWHPRIPPTAGCDGRGFEWALGLLAMLNDRRYDCGRMKRSAVLQIVRKAINNVLDGVPPIAQDGPGRPASRVPRRRIELSTRDDLRPPRAGETTLVIFAEGFPPEGDQCDARLAVRAYQLGWRRLIVYGLRGQRFTGCGLGPKTDGVRIDVFGSSGDYLASGIDGLEIHVHGSAQDQLGQIIKRGTLVVHGDVGQTFMYGAKGGEVYVLGNAAGRPLINAAGRPRVVINGTCLDYLAESFMAGDPHHGGGFVVINGIEFDHRGRVREQASPYPGSNLFSLASGGAIFVRDPHHKLIAEQLNGGEFAEFTDQDWQLILPYLEANQRHFGISIQRDLLTIDGRPRPPRQVYRKVRAVRLAVLSKEMVPE
jgi:glutamate synthase domain-containing protein 1/glutamate synthase domain-containing protein 3